MNKKAIALAFNAIIISILALIVLIVMIGFFTGSFTKLRDRLEAFPTLEVEPSANEPITFIPTVIYRGKQNKMSVGFYNTEIDDVPNTIFPEIECNGIDSVMVKTMGANVPVGQWKMYSVLISVPSNTPVTRYPCLIKVSKTDKSFFMEVK